MKASIFEIITSKSVTNNEKRIQRLPAKMKRLAAGTLAGSLVAGMLFMAGCDEMKSMEQIYPKEVVEMLEDNGFTSKDYDAKKEEFMAEQDEYNLAPELQVVPEKWFVEKLGVPEEDVKDRLFCSLVAFLGDDLYLGAMYFPEGGVTENGQWRAYTHPTLTGYSYDPVIYQALFKYPLDSKTARALKNAFQSNDVVCNPVDSGMTEYEYGKEEGVVRKDRINNFVARYLLDAILTTKEPILESGEFRRYVCISQTDRTQVLDDFLYNRGPCETFSGSGFFFGNNGSKWILYSLGGTKDIRVGEYNGEKIEYDAGYVTTSGIKMGDLDYVAHYYTTTGADKLFHQASEWVDKSPEKVNEK